MSTEQRGPDGATDVTGSTGQETPIYDQLVEELGEPGDSDGRAAD